ncbi:hypothetical protein DRN84_00100 [Candidatus Geothermarchaeota archaeon]|nr:MAG: hypothetical protein DRN87_01300 [Candidatus Geothermarchaeota archaeon]RLG63086.1 MAG: hypothetical protein DRN84_00100 [Candidatus Geothermarchaeota archaeon]HEW93388.1 hypothetical protein [Thermoprotei archaeon]
MNPWEKLKPPLKCDVLEEEAFSKASKAANKIPYQGKLRTARRREEARVMVLANVFEKHLNRAIKILSTYFETDEFYRELVKLYFSEGDIKRILKRFRGLLEVINKIRGDYIHRISREEDISKLTRIRREAQGRIASLIKDIAEDMDIVIDLYKYCRRLPSLDLEYPVFIVAGAPNTGKSSLVKKLSTANVKIASYPFTTKEIHVGHMRENYFIAQFIDTPGLLDRPISEKNPVEMKAILALKYLKGEIIYLFDPSPERYYDPDKQFNIYFSITESFPDKEVLPVINKVDYIDGNVYNEIKKRLENLDYLEISILKDINISMLKKKIIEYIKKNYLKLRT